MEHVLIFAIKKAIQSVSDECGFEYPKIDKEKCINCGLCDKICPMINKKAYNTIEKGYVAINKNDEIRQNSTSGGAFSAIAKNILDKNGIVFGAAFDKNFEVKHISISDVKSLSKIRGSKYVQSEIGYTFRTIKKLLDENRYVLFSGTPWQVMV